MRFTRKIKLALNIISLSGALIFILVAVVMTYSRDAMDLLGQSYIHGYSRIFQKEYDEAILNLDKNDIVLVEEQLDDWKDVLKGDRAYSKKRALLLAMSGELHRTKQYVKMRKWSKLWLEMDDRDITAKAYYYEALRNSQDAHDDGVQGLAAMYKAFPINHTSTTFYIASLQELGESEEVNQLISAIRVNQLSALCQQKRWQLFWDVGNGFNGKDSLKELALTKNGNERWSISAVISGKIKRLRIDLPSSSKVNVTNIKLKNKVAMYDISTADMKLHMVGREGEKLVASGGNDPYFSFDVSPYFKDTGDSNKIEVSFKVGLAHYKKLTGVTN